MGATYVVLAPEHPLALELGNADEVKTYRRPGANQSRQRRRRGRDAASPWRRAAAPPRLRRVYSVETSRSHAAAATWIVRGDGSRRGRGRDAASPRRKVAAAMPTFGGDRRRRASRRRYADAAARKSDMDRTADAKTKTGVATASFAVHPLTGATVPIWVADYVLGAYRPRRRSLSRSGPRRRDAERPRTGRGYDVDGPRRRRRAQVRHGRGHGGARARRPRLCLRGGL